jgi:signal peptidase II
MQGGSPQEVSLSKLKDYLFLFGVAGGIVALDQLTKYRVRSSLALGEMWSPAAWLEPYARVVNWHNTVAAFGIFPSASIIITIVAILVAGGIIYYFPRVPRGMLLVRIALGLQLGGALGNLIDRMFFGTVTDFISLWTFPVFNVADASITIGTALLIGSMLLEDRRPAADEEPAAGDGNTDEAHEVQESIG